MDGRANSLKKGRMTNCNPAPQRRSQLHLIRPNRRMFRHQECQLLRLLQTLQERGILSPCAAVYSWNSTRQNTFFASGFWELLCDIFFLEIGSCWPRWQGSTRMCEGNTKNTNKIGNKWKEAAKMWFNICCKNILLAFDSVYLFILV